MIDYLSFEFWILVCWVDGFFLMIILENVMVWDFEYFGNEMFYFFKKFFNYIDDFYYYFLIIFINGSRRLKE